MREALWLLDEFIDLSKLASFFEFAPIYIFPYLFIYMKYVCSYIYEYIYIYLDLSRYAFAFIAKCGLACIY